MFTAPSGVTLEMGMRMGHSGEDVWKQYIEKLSPKCGRGETHSHLHNVTVSQFHSKDFLFCVPFMA